MTKLEREAIKAPAPGLQVFVTDFNNGKGAVMFYNGEEWTALANLIARPDPPTDVEATFTGAASDSSEVTVLLELQKITEAQQSRSMRLLYIYQKVKDFQQFYHQLTMDHYTLKSFQ